MWLYITKGIFVVALAGIIYLIIRTYPLVQEEQEQEESTTKKPQGASDTMYELDKKILVFIEKGLRKARVAILKVDHAVSQKLDTVKKKSRAHEKNSLEVFTELEKKDKNTDSTGNE
ncbi:MAG: hypothetical protein WC099_00815 [Candidatus Paceibacterota bacterium]